jgi:hypothetical protein
MSHKSRGRGAEKTLHDDFILFRIHLTARLQSVYSCCEPVGMTKVLKVSQGKAFFIASASLRSFSMQL